MKPRQNNVLIWKIGSTESYPIAQEQQLTKQISMYLTQRQYLYIDPMLFICTNTHIHIHKYTKTQYFVIAY